jgi:hypothetical protein
MSETKTMAHPHIAHNGQTEVWRAGLPFHEAEIGTMIPPSSLGGQILRFLQHFGEVVQAMLLGMAVFDVVNGAILVPMGLASLSGSPQISAASMAFVMTVPMVAWMRLRKHTWQPSAEMAGRWSFPPSCSSQLARSAY